MKNSKRKVYIFKNKNELEEFAIKKWKEISAKALNNKGFFTVALSGGSTPLGFYKNISAHVNNIFWNKTHIFQVDERFVSSNDIDSNYRLLKENLLEPARLKDNNIHYISIYGKKCEIIAQKYEQKIKTFFNLKKGDFPEFDLIILGIGEDGHTASLFPGNPLSKEVRLITAVKEKKVKHERISITMQVINNAKNIIFIVCGSNKSQIVKEVIEKRNKKFPASYVCPKKGKLIFILDEESGSGLL